MDRNSPHSSPTFFQGNVNAVVVLRIREGLDGDREQVDGWLRSGRWREGRGECMLRLHDDMHVAYTSVVDVCERESTSSVLGRHCMQTRSRGWPHHDFRLVWMDPYVFVRGLPDSL